MMFAWEKINKKGLIIIIISLSFFAALVYSFSYQISPVVDAKAYHSIAVNLITGNGFRESATGDILFDRSIQRAGPAYEYFLAGLYYIFGIHYEVVWVAQAILHALSVWLLYQISQLVFAEKGQIIGLIAAAIFGFHPDLIEISAMMMTETLYLFLTILSLYCFVKVFVEQKWQWTLALAVSLALGILARPPLILFIPIVGFLYLSRKQWYQLILFSCLIGLCLTPWTIRNYQIYHQFIPTTLIGEYNLWVGNTVLADGGQLADGYNPFDDYAAEHGYVAIHSAAINAFTNFITEHPGRFIELSLIRTVRYFSLIRPMGFWFYQADLSQLIFVGFSGLGIAVLFIFGGAGFIRMAKEKSPLFNYLIIFAISAPILLLPTVVQSRYRFQIYPFLALAAGYILFILTQEKKWWKGKELVISASSLLFVSLLDILINTDKIILRIKSLL